MLAIKHRWSIVWATKTLELLLVKFVHSRFTNYSRNTAAGELRQNLITGKV